MENAEKPKKIGDFVKAIAEQLPPDPAPDAPPMAAVAVTKHKRPRKIPADSPLAQKGRRPVPEKRISAKVRFRNALARAAQCLTLAEKRLVTLCIGQLDSRKECQTPGLLITKLRAKTYAEKFDLDIKQAYREMRKASDTLYDRSICYYEDWEGEELAMTVQMRWVYTLKQAHGYVELHWSPDLVPVLTNLKGNYTTYKLQYATALKSIYSWRLLELFHSYHPMTEHTFEINKFYDALELSNALRKDFGQVRRRVIEPAVRELKDKDGWIVEWEPIIPGSRKVEEIKFKWRRDNQGRLF